MADRPTPGQLYNQAAGDTARYLELMREHGYVLKPGDEGYEQGSRTLPCGWPGPQKPEAWCILGPAPGVVLALHRPRRGDRRRGYARAWPLVLGAV